MILGTAAYMSPEQARGKAVDRRADIWAFGVVLFEMLTGRRLFEGETISDTLAAVLGTRRRLEPAGGDPARVRRLLERCLERDPKRRLRDIGEARVRLLHETLAGRTASATTTLRRAGSGSCGALPWLLAVGLGVVAFVPRGGERHGRGARPGTVRFAFDARDALRPVVRLSPDGRLRRLQPGSLSSENGIFVRPLASLEATAPPGHEPIGRVLLVAGREGDRLATRRAGSRRWTWAPGVARTIADLPDAPVRGGAWGRDGVILVSVDGAIQRVSAAGGSARRPCSRRRRTGTPGTAGAVFLPDGRRFLFTSEMPRGGRERAASIQVA